MDASPLWKDFLHDLVSVVAPNGPLHDRVDELFSEKKEDSSHADE